MSIRQKTRINLFFKDNMFSSWISQSTWNHCFLLTHFKLLVFAYQYGTPLSYILKCKIFDLSHQGILKEIYLETEGKIINQ
jgi:hypothetical protein